MPTQQARNFPTASVDSVKANGESRLGAICATVAEAAWLLVLIIIPLHFNIHSNNTFGLDKVAAIRALSVLMALACVVYALERGKSGLAFSRKSALRRGFLTTSSLMRRAKANPWILLGILFLVVQTVSTALSVAPQMSFWGSYNRFQGLYTTAAYLTIFFAILAFANRWIQVERLLQVILTVSLPVSLYGIIQNFGADPVVWAGGVSVRVGSTMGNPIFLGAFLVMVAPLTLYRHIESGRRVAEDLTPGLKAVLVLGGVANVLIQVVAWLLGPVSGTLASVATLGIWSVEGRLLGKSIWPFLRIGTFSVLLSAQLACLLLSQSRGPLLALLAASTILVFLWAAVRGKWIWVSATVGFVVVGGLLVTFVGPSLQPEWVREVPYLSRFAQASEGAGRVRLHIWEAAGELLEKDRMRTVVGHGPETMQLVMTPHLSPALGLVERRGAIPDRAHNETLDVLVTTGIVGFGVYLMLFIGIFARGFRSVGVADLRLHRWVFVGACLAGGLAGVILVRHFDQSWRLFGIAFPFGILAGSMAYLTSYAIRNFLKRERPADRWGKRQLLAAFLLSAIIAHFVEIQFGIAITVTRTYFWIYLATLIVITRPLIRQEGAGTGFTAEPDSKGGNSASPHFVGSLTLSLILITVAFSFSPGSPGLSISTVWILAFTWVVGALMGLTGAIKEEGTRLPALLKAGAIYVGAAVLCASLLALIHAGRPGRLGDPASMPLLYHSLLLVFLAAIGIVLLRRKCLPAPAWTFSAAAGGVLLAVVTGFVIVTTCLNVAKADIHFKQARLLSTHPGQVDRAVDLTRLAIRLQPAQDVYRGFLGQLLGRKGENATESALRDELFREARSNLLASRVLSPLDAHHAAALAGLHRSWARHTEDQLRQRSLLGRALLHYGEALERYPGNILWWNEKGSIHRLLGDYDRARESYQHSLKLDDSVGRTHWHLGELYLAQGKWEDAAKAYGRAISRNPGMVDGFRGLARAYFQLGPVTESIQVHEHLLTLVPDDLAARQRLAQLYASAGHFALAVAHAERALELAPAQARPAIERMLDELRTHERRSNP